MVSDRPQAEGGKSQAELLCPEQLLQTLPWKPAAGFSAPPRDWDNLPATVGMGWGPRVVLLPQDEAVWAVLCRVNCTGTRDSVVH